MSKVKDLTGNTYGYLTVTSYAGRNENMTRRKTQWNCKCKCGNTCVIMGESLTQNHTKSCGCFYKEVMNKKVEKHIGDKYDRLLIISPTYVKKGDHQTYLCQCDCGNAAIVSIGHLRSGHTKSCGCLTIETLKARTGDKGPGWKPELTNKIRNIRRDQERIDPLRDYVYKRDKYTCRACDKRGGVLQMHHIKSWRNFKKFRYKKINVITLCAPCHKDFHKKYGIHDRDKKAHLNFFKWLNKKKKEK